MNLSNISLQEDFSSHKDSPSSIYSTSSEHPTYTSNTAYVQKSNTNNSLFLPQSDLRVIKIFQIYYLSSSLLACCLRESVERGHCTNCIHCMHRKRPFFIYSRTTISPLYPDAAICCSYFINVLLGNIGLKAAKLCSINCNKWKASGYIYRFTLHCCSSGTDSERKNYPSLLRYSY